MPDISCTARNDNYGLRIAQSTINAYKQAGYTKVYLKGYIYASNISNWGYIDGTYDINLIKDGIITGGTKEVANATVTFKQ